MQTSLVCGVTLILMTHSEDHSLRLKARTVSNIQCKNKTDGRGGDRLSPMGEILSYSLCAAAESFEDVDSDYLFS